MKSTTHCSYGWFLGRLLKEFADSLRHLVSRPAARVVLLFLAAFLPTITAATVAQSQVYQSASTTSYSAAGQTITFTYTYHTGSYAVSALSITGTIYDTGGSPVATLSPSCSGLPTGTNATITCTAAYTTTASDVSTGRTMQAYVTNYSVTNATNGSVFETGSQGSPALITISYVPSVTQSISFDALADTPFTSTPPALTATASSGLAVSYASTTGGVCTVSGSTISFVSAGTCSITASQAGDASYAAATPVSRSFSVTPGVNTITFTAPADRALSSGDFGLTATASSGLAVAFASNTAATCDVTGSTVSLLNVGTCTIVASSAGNSNYAAATSVSQSFSITAAVTTTTLSASSTSINYGTSITFTATVSGVAPTGTITFKDGATTLGAVALSGGTASFSTSGLSSGAHSITASYGGDSSNQVSISNTLSVSIVARPDPTLDPDVVGTVNAQAAAMQRFAQGQLDNIGGRLRQLHGTPPNGVWAAGLNSFGSLLQTASPGNTFVTSSLTVGFDHAFQDGWHTGIALGYGWDSTLVGTNGSRTNGSSISASLYSSYRFTPDIFLDVSGGFGYSSFTSKRYSTVGAVFLTGNRTGYEVFGSATLTSEQTFGGLTLAPYGGINAVHSVLNPYTETGSSVWALSYQTATVNSVDAVAGLRATLDIPVNWGSLSLNGHIEATRSFGGLFSQTLGYADLGNGSSYTLIGGLTRAGQGRGGLAVAAQMGGFDLNLGYDFTLSGLQLQSQTLSGGLLFAF